MKTSKAKVLGSVASSLLLVSAGAAVAAPAINAATATDAVAQEATAVEGASIAANQKAVANVQGDFGYTQDAMTSNSVLASVFNKAAAVLCTGLPNYAISATGDPIQITGETQMDATVAELQADDAAASVLMACACATNVAGGGAMANADVSGVTLASIAERVQVQQG